MSTCLLRSFILTIVAALALPTLSVAQTIPKEKGAARTVKMFDFYCLSRLPDLESIERAAGLGEYDQLIGDDLRPYAPDSAAEQFHGWRFHDQGEAFVLTAYRAPPGAAGNAPPPFAKSQSVSCEFHISASAPEQILAELTKLLGRAPDKSAGAQGHTWTLQTDKAFSEVRFSPPMGGDKNVVLSARVLLKS
jgi:hypothetical protein